jgi:hypothetical protein
VGKDDGCANGDEDANVEGSELGCDDGGVDGCTLGNAVG